MSKQELATVVYTALKDQSLKLSKNRTVVSVFTQDNKQVRFKTDTIGLPFGANVNKFKTFGPSEYYLECNISPSLKTELENLCNTIQNLIHENQSLFNVENLTLDQIKSRWTHPIRTDTYGSKIRVKIARNKSTDDLDFNVFDANLGATSKEQYVFIDDKNISQVFKPKSRVMMAIKIGNVYHFKDKFGITLFASQVKFEKATPLKASQDLDPELDMLDDEGDEKKDKSFKSTDDVTMLDDF